MVIGNKVKVVYLESCDIRDTNLTIGMVGVIEANGAGHDPKYIEGEDVFYVMFSNKFVAKIKATCQNKDGTYQMYRKQLEVVSDISVSEQRYLVEKQVNSEWYPEGKGTIAYVNRVLESFAGIGTVLRISIVEGV